MRCFRVRSIFSVDFEMISQTQAIIHDVGHILGLGQYKIPDPDAQSAAAPRMVSGRNGPSVMNGFSGSGGILGLKWLSVDGRNNLRCLESEARRDTAMASSTMRCNMSERLLTVFV